MGAPIRRRALRNGCTNVKHNTHILYVHQFQVKIVVTSRDGSAGTGYESNVVRACFHSDIPS